MDITKMSLMELKALAYDLRSNLVIIEQAIQQKSKVVQPTGVSKTEEEIKNEPTN